MFVKLNGRLVNADTIRQVQYDELASKGHVRVVFQGSTPNSSDGRIELVEGPPAFNLVMALCPDALEGEGAKYQRHAWAVHNIIGHPLMQVCAWLGLTPLGLKIHDMTVPNPITNKIS
jgi:hypothetical protein